MFTSIILSFRSTVQRIKTYVPRFRKIEAILIADYLEKHLHNNPKYQNPKRLTTFEHQVYSQNGEDGIIEEIFSRVGTTNRVFVEFGVENGLQSNTTFLLLKNWSGFWIEADSKHVKFIQRKFGKLTTIKKLLVKHAFITKENIEELFGEMNVPERFDLLSIDIDGNDYWVWESISRYQPRVVVIEYNPLFRPPVRWVMKYNLHHVWKRTSYFGASLQALQELGLKKGYKLVGCDFTGTNAFFVKQELVGDKFMEPFTAENHYEPARHFLTRTTGHRREFGDGIGEL